MKIPDCPVFSVLPQKEKNGPNSVDMNLLSLVDWTSFLFFFWLFKLSKKLIVKEILLHSPDIVCLQEPTKSMFADLKGELGKHYHGNMFFLLAWHFTQYWMKSRSVEWKNPIRLQMNKL